MNRSQVEPSAPGYSSSESSEKRPASSTHSAPPPASTGGGGGKKIILAVLGMIVLAGAYFVFNPPSKGPDAGGGDTGTKGGGKKDRPVPVTVATAQIQNVPIEIRSIGNVLPFSVVNVVPQVSGQLTKVTFTQGDTVKKGDLLFQIDPRSYQANLDQTLGTVAKDRAGVQAAQANLEKDKAQVGMLQANYQKDVASQQYAQAEQGRYQTLVQQGAVSHEQSDQMATNNATAQAVMEADKKQIENAREVLNADKAAIATAMGTLEADKAAADNARLQLEWTQIRSPIDGRTGSLNVYQGNVIQANQATPLVTIDQVQPIYIQFTLPEQYLDGIRKAQADNTLKVKAMVEGQMRDSVQGTVSFLQHTVDTTSGTVSMRAIFANSEKRLFTGQFVDVIVTMPAEGSTVVVPQTALQTSQQGNSVYVVKPNNTVSFVSVDLKRTFGDMAAISGLNAGDVVVTDGQLQLTPGAKISIQENPFGKRKDDASNAGAPPSESQ